VSPAPERAVLSIGSNLGDRLGHLQGALDQLAERGIRVLGVSPVYQTAPVGGVEQDDFLNIIAIVESDLSPVDLLARCQEVEAVHDRVRDIRWGPRTLDVDIVSIDGIVMDDPALTLPHPRAHERAFVCIPWLDIDPAARIGTDDVASLELETAGVQRRDDLRLRRPGGTR
jgi:2-amino-4-hydroxy-6-hydroxymethyldihydropteridine diphosphokinase